MFDLVVFAFEVFEDCCFFDDEICELLPLHISVAIDVDLFEEVGEVSDQSGLAIG